MVHIPAKLRVMQSCTYDLTNIGMFEKMKPRGIPTLRYNDFGKEPNKNILERRYPHALYWDGLSYIKFRFCCGQ
jgi:hypothetical protein